MMSPRHPDETSEWLQGRVDSWVETYKKAMLTPVVLRHILNSEPITVAELAIQVQSATGWRLTEHGLYRTIRRLEDAALIATTDVPAPRTGARRKELTLSQLGKSFLAGIEDNIIDLHEESTPPPE